MVRGATRQVTVGLLLVFAFWVLCIQMAYATGNGGDHTCQGGHNCNNNGDNHGGQTVAESEATATAESVSGASADASSYSEGSTSSSVSQAGDSQSAASASNDGVTVEGDRVENNSSNIVLVPNNNTESCLRVWGIAFGRNGESGALGIPWRSARCDYEQAADDAFAAGERELGWFWKCQNKSLYKTFKLEGMSNDEAKQECHKKAVGAVGNLKTIDTLREQLATSEDLRKIERDRHEKLTQQLKEQCEESKDRIADACMK